MPAALVYEPRTGRLVGSVAGQSFSLLTQHAAGAVTHWQHEAEFRPGKWTPTDYSFEVPGQRGPALRSLHLSILTEVDRLRVAARGIYAMNHCLRARQGAIMLAEDDKGACLVHAWPPCRSPCCLVIPHHFAELAQAVALENAQAPGVPHS